MGTRVEATLNPLGAAHNNNNNNTLLFLRSSVQRVNEWQHNLQDIELFLYNNTSTSSSGVAAAAAMSSSGVDNFHEAVNKMLQKGDVDAIRSTMQLHENVFKNQVKELHRVYSVQRRLIEESKQNSLWGSSIGINHLQFNKQQSTGSGSGGKMILSLQSSSSFRDNNNNDPINTSTTRERSGSCSGDNMRIMSRGFDLERPANAAAAEETTDMSTGVSTVDEDGQANVKMSIEEEEGSDVELSLSIGGRSQRKQSRSRRREIDDSLKSENRGADHQECSDPSTPMSSSSATCDNQETKRPHWLFQSLKLK